MHQKSILLSLTLLSALSTSALAQRGGAGRGLGATAADTAEDPVKTMVGRLDLEQYKATVKGLTQFGDRRQGTKRNRDAV
ncbi:MAG: peptidase M28, partial [Gemmatimonadaceae bacterium]